MRATRRKTRDKYILKNMVRTVFITILLVIIIGGILFVRIEGWEFADAIYFIVMTITTIGYGDIVPVTQIGRLLAIVFALSGVPIFIGIVGLVFEERFKNSINKHMGILAQELVETEDKLEKTESLLLTEEKKLVKIEKEHTEETQKKQENFFRRIFSKNEKS